MSPSTPESTKKCPSCQQWSVWHLLPTDLCTECGALLDPRALQNAVNRDELDNREMPGMILVQIHPEDGPIVRFFKSIVRGGQLLFAAIVAFIVWLVTVVAA